MRDELPTLAAECVSGSRNKNPLGEEVKEDSVLYSLSVRKLSEVFDEELCLNNGAGEDS